MREDMVRIGSGCSPQRRDAGAMARRRGGAGAPRPRRRRDPEQDFVDSLYDMDVEPGKNGNRVFGFPVTAVISCVLLPCEGA